MMYANSNVARRLAQFTDRSVQKLRRRINDGDNLKLVSSPAIMVEEMIRNLPSEDDLIVKRTIFMLQKYLKVRQRRFSQRGSLILTSALQEEDFAEEFVAKGGLSILQDVIITGMGNTLAYALTSLQALMEHDTGWDAFGPQFISTVSQL